MGVILSLLLGFLPMLLYAGFINWLDRYEKEPKILLGVVFVWGAVVAAGIAFLINTLLGVSIYFFTNSEAATELTTGSIIAPVVEESLKGLAVLMVYLLYRSEFDSALDGIVYAAVAALGFAASENAFYIYQYGYAQEGISGVLAIAFVRVILVGWQHPFYTAFTGIGLAVTRLTRSPTIKFIAPPAGWLAAVFTHSVHNTLASLLSGSRGLVIGTIFDWSGWLFMLLFVAWAIVREGSWIKRQLIEEVNLGLISLAQYTTACSPSSQSRARLTALFTGRYSATNRFYQTCAELAHKKQQLDRLGDERGNKAAVEHLRGELTRLAPQAQS